MVSRNNYDTVEDLDDKTDFEKIVRLTINSKSEITDYGKLI